MYLEITTVSRLPQKARLLICTFFSFDYISENEYPHYSMKILLPTED